MVLIIIFYASNIANPLNSPNRNSSFKIDESLLFSHELPMNPIDVKSDVIPRPHNRVLAEFYI